MLGIIAQSTNHRVLSQIKDHPYIFVDLDLETPFLKALQKGIIDCGFCFYYPGYFSTLEEDRFKGVVFTKISNYKLSICMMKSNRLAQQSALSLKDLRGATIAILSGNHFDDWKAILSCIFGRDTDLAFHLKPIGTLRNLETIELGDMLHVCDYETDADYLSDREDMVIFDRVDGNELFVDIAFAYLEDNERAAAFGASLEQAFAGL
jgi:hypothetical protein